MLLRLFVILTPILFLNFADKVHAFNSNEPVEQAQNRPISLGRTLSKPQRVLFIQENLNEIVSECKNRKDIIIRLRDVDILCYHGVISRNEEIEIYNRDYSIAYINSSGGDIKFSFELGREIFRNGTHAVIDGHCHSSCANYLLPATHKIYITNNTVISMHTSLPRTRDDFVRVRFPEEYQSIRERIRTEGPNPEVLSRYIELTDRYDHFYNEIVIAESLFFKSINTDIAYTYRYREIYRTLQRRENYNCKPRAGLHLLIGPDFLQEFKIQTIRSWFPDDRAEYVNLLPHSSANNALIYDFEEHPFWLPENGLMISRECANM